MQHSEVNHIIEAFKSWDETGSGIISREDLSSIIRALSPGIGEDDLEKLFAAAASDGLPANHLRYEDFVTWLWLPTPGDKADKAAAPVPPPKATKPANARPVKKAPTQQQASPAPASASSSSAPPAAGLTTVGPTDEERRRGILWQGALADATTKSARKYPEEKVRQYFEEVQQRVAGEEYALHVRSVLFQQVDTDKDGKVSFAQVASIIGKSLQCASDMASERRMPITMKEIRAAFDAHNTPQNCRGIMGEDEFVNLMRYLQVRVAEAAMPMSRLVKT